MNRMSGLHFMTSYSTCDHGIDKLLWPACCLSRQVLIRNERSRSLQSKTIAMASNDMADKLNLSREEE